MAIGLDFRVLEAELSGEIDGRAGVVCEVVRDTAGIAICGLYRAPPWAGAVQHKHSVWYRVVVLWRRCDRVVGVEGVGVGGGIQVRDHTVSCSG